MKKQYHNNIQPKVKVIAVFLLITFLQSICFPTVSWALTSVHQTEYTSYETLQNTDMVDLITGDFNYTIPLLHVPGPEGGFSMPLAYHGGIEVDEEASWVGLGWSFNPGAIVRDVRQFPDDFSGQEVSTQVYNTGGNGYSINFIFGNYSYDSERGTGGAIGLGTVLSFGYGTQHGMTAIGVTYDGNDVNADPLGVASAIFSIASMYAGAAVAATSSKGAVASSLYSNSRMAIGIAAGINTQVTNINDWKITTKNRFLYSKYDYYLDVTKTENMYGSLYYGQIGANNGIYQQAPQYAIRVFDGSIPSLTNYHNYTPYAYKDNYTTEGMKIATDMYASINSSTPVEHQIYSSHITYDGYKVMGGDISGNIEPYRLDVGSLSLPLVSEDGTQYAMSRFHQSGVGSDKVDFRYLGEKANYYFHHLGTQQPASYPPYDMQTAIGTQLTTVQDEVPGSSTLGDYPAFVLTDPIFYNSSDRIEANRTDGSYANGKLTKPNHVKWFTNQELGYPGSSTSAYTIGGYEITSKEGVTYHYKLPVYNKYQESFSMTTYPNFNKTTITNDYPITWLLTAITGSDYIDRGTSGMSDDDWGYWVVFDYGKVSSHYTYRQPYYGASVDDIQNADKFNLGQRESYYLNTIKTRTHTALFIKDVRQDGRSARQDGVSNASISSSLKLEEVIVLTNKDFIELTSSPLSLSKNSGVSQTLTNGDVLTNVYDVNDMNSSIEQFIIDNQISKVKFNYEAYTTSLCDKTLNSFSNASSPPSTGVGGGGKLTLTSVSQYGRNNIKLTPDYLFDYNTPNPDYNFWKKDAWGMYQTTSLTGNDLKIYKSKYPTLDSKGDEWCLNKITTPLGGEILVDYERDDYSSVSGTQPKMKFILDTDYSSSGVLNSYYKDIDLTDYLTVGQQIEVHATVNFVCDYAFTGQTPVAYSQTQTITAVSPTYITVSDPPDFPTPDPGEIIGDDNPCPNSTLNPNGYILFDIINKKGGQNRVKTLTVKDENDNEYTTTYRYTVDGSENGKSSGVIAKEPEGVIGVKHHFYNHFDFPNTPILYGKVSVLKGKSATKEAVSKSVFDFETPHYSMVDSRTEQIFDDYVNFLNPDDDIFKIYNFNIKVNTSTIGQLKSVKHYNNKGFLISKVEYGYETSKTDYNNQTPLNLGAFTAGTLTGRFSFLPSDDARYYNFFRTTKSYSSSSLRTVSITENNEKKVITNTEYDLATGIVLETEYEDAWGNRFKTQMVPAYKKYSTMGSKYVNDSYRNMLSQPTAEYLYTLNKNTNDWEVVSASIQTWSGDWSYREYDATSEKYEVIPYSNEVWRKNKSYAWKAHIDEKGTYKTTGVDQFEDFDWTELAINQNWKKINEISLYDHYSNPLESKDIVGKYVATKFGYDNSKQITSASNTRYVDVAYSGAEDEVINNHFGGEVLKGSGSNIYNALTSGYQYVHTGDKSLSVVDGEFAFIFRNYNYNASHNRRYKASVWVHEDNAVEARLAVVMNDGGIGGTNILYLTKDVDFLNTPKSGAWYLLEIDIPNIDDNALVTNVDYIEIQAFNPTANQGNTAPIYFDDFMVHPTMAPMNSYVYDDKTGLVTAIIDNNGIAVKFEYDDAGRLKKSYREVLNKGFVKTAEYEYNYAR